MNLNSEQLQAYTLKVFGFSVALGTLMKILGIALVASAVLIMLMSYLDKSKAAIIIGILSALVLVVLGIAAVIA